MFNFVVRVARVREASFTAAPTWGFFMKNARVAFALVTEVLLTNGRADGGGGVLRFLQMC